MGHSGNAHPQDEACQKYVVTAACTPLVSPSRGKLKAVRPFERAQSSLPATSSK